jgi:RNA polymerase sigma-70 factor (ECF subfamily)
MNSDNIIQFSGKGAESPGKRPLEDLEDDELILMARGGVEEAFDVLVRRHQAVVHRVASRVLGQGILADDAVQNTFLAIYSHIHDYQPRGRYRQFMFQILINQCRLILRSAGRDQKLQERLSAVPHIRPSTPDEEVLEREKNKEINRALSRLDYKLRIVLVLRFATDLSYAEIGQVLDIPIGTVKSRMSNGIVRMRRIMKGKSP